MNRVLKLLIQDLFLSVPRTSYNNAPLDKRFRHLLVGLLVIQIGVITACSTSVETVDLSDSSPIGLTYALSEEPATFDPHIAESPQVGIVLRQVYDTLVYRESRTGAFVPGLATDWAISEDGTEYTFRLRDGVEFHDGTSFNAIAVGVNLDRIIDLDGHAASLLGSYRGYEIVDSQTIRIRLEEPYAPLLDVLSQYYFGMASPLALSEVSVPRYQFHQVGTGPYQFMDFVPGSHIRLELNEVYTGGADIYPIGERNPPKGVEFIFITEREQRVTALADGTVDVMGQLSPSEARSLSVNAGVQVVPVPIAGQPMMFLMNSQQFPTDNAVIRQALLYGTNRSEMLDVIFEGFSQIAWGPITGGTLFFTNEVVGLYDYDITQARTLIESAGFTDDDDDGIFDIDGIDLQVTLLVQPGDLYEDVARKIQEQWRIIGVETVIEFRPTQPSLEVAVEEGEYNLVAVSNDGVDPFFLADYLASDGEQNWIGVSDPSLDDVVQVSMRAQDINVRAAAYVQMQRFLMNEALVLPIAEVTVLNGIRTNVVAMPFDVYGWYPLLYDAAIVDQPGA